MGKTLILPSDSDLRELENGQEETYPLPKLLGDERRLRQVLINLVKNAIKFTKRGATISVLASYEPSSEMLTVDVKDNGVGIAAEDFPKLFTRFGKLHRTAKMNSQGIGLGLTIVKEIVTLGGGNVDVFSEGVGEGCCFTFSMKMSQANPAPRS